MSRVRPKLDPPSVLRLVDAALDELAAQAEHVGDARHGQGPAHPEQVQDRADSHGYGARLLELANRLSVQRAQQVEDRCELGR